MLSQCRTWRRPPDCHTLTQSRASLLAPVPMPDHVSLPYCHVTRSQSRAIPMMRDLTATARYCLQVASEDAPAPKTLQHVQSQVTWLLQAGMRFGFKVHQFAGGFDSEAAALFHNVRQELELLSDSNKPAA